MSSSNGSLVIAIKMKANCTVLAVAILSVYILRSNTVTEVAYNFKFKIVSAP
jgi:hypothetical protein